MKLHRSTFLSAIVALAASGGIALAISGNQLGFPIANGPSYCASIGNGGVCNSTIAAGPAITGNETIIANTNLAGGVNPQTVLLNMASLNALPYQYVAGTAVALNATTTTVAATTGTLIIDPGGTVTTYAVTLAAATALTDGQLFKLSSSKTLTALVMTAGTGTSISNSPTALTISTTASYGYEFIYNAAVTTWFRLQ